MPEAATIVKNLLRWYPQVARELPWRRQQDPYGIWVSEIMLQQTQVKTVIPYWERWMKQLPDVRSLAQAQESTVIKLWEGLGYYSRARNLQRAAQEIQIQHDGCFPDDHDALLALPGIGPYTAGAISSIAFGQPRPIVDGNVIRVLTRVDGIDESTKLGHTIRQLWARSESLVLQASKRGESGRNVCGDLNQSLMELGATVCLPRQPLCSDCPLRRSCRARTNGTIETIPNLGKRKKMISRMFMAVVIRRSGMYLVRQRRTGEINGGLWEFPNVELTGSDPGGACWLGAGLRIDSSKLSTLGEIKHSITNNRITVKAYSVEVSPEYCAEDDSSEWLDESALEKYAFTAAHRKIARRVIKSSDS